MTQALFGGLIVAGVGALAAMIWMIIVKRRNDRITRK